MATDKYTHTHIHTYTHTHIHANVCTYIRMYIHAYTSVAILAQVEAGTWTLSIVRWRLGPSGHTSAPLSSRLLGPPVPRCPRAQPAIGIIARSLCILRGSKQVRLRLAGRRAFLATKVRCWTFAGTPRLVSEWARIYSAHLEDKHYRVTRTTWRLHRFASLDGDLVRARNLILGPNRARPPRILNSSPTRRLGYGR